MVGVEVTTIRRSQACKRSLSNARYQSASNAGFRAIELHQSMTVFAGIDSGGLGSLPSVTSRCNQVSSGSGVFGIAT